MFEAPKSLHPCRVSVMGRKCRLDRMRFYSRKAATERDGTVLANICNDNPFTKLHLESQGVFLPALTPAALSRAGSGKTIDK